MGWACQNISGFAELRLVLLTSSSGIAAMREALIDAFEQLRAIGVERISAVGGRGLATELIDAGLVQDLYLTTSPITGGEPGTPWKALRGHASTVQRRRRRCFESIPHTVSAAFCF